MPPDRLVDERSLAAMGERVARVETKIEGVEKSTDIIRQQGHDIRNELQKIVGAEERRDANIRILTEQTADLPGLMVSVRFLEELRPQLQALIDESAARRGAWKAICMLGAAIIGAVTVIAAILGGVAWIYSKITGH